MRSRRQSISGKRGEDAVIEFLCYLGFLDVQRVGTPVKACRPIPGKPGRFEVVFGEKVSGDGRAVLPGGKSVLFETKTTSGTENLAWSQMEKHQPERLTRHADTGAVSLLIWNCPAGIFVMRWPVAGFGPRKSIDPETAAGLHIPSADFLC